MRRSQPSVSSECNASGKRGSLASRRCAAVLRPWAAAAKAVAPPFCPVAAPVTVALTVAAAVMEPVEPLTAAACAALTAPVGRDAWAACFSSLPPSTCATKAPRVRAPATSSQAAAKPRRLAWVAAEPPPPAFTASSNCRRSKGSRPLPAIAPSITALTTVPCWRARPAMSSTWCSRLKAATSFIRAWSSRRPSPGAMRSRVVRVRAEELSTSVRSALSMPLPAWRAVSSNSDDTSASSAPGTGLRLNTRGAPERSLSRCGSNSR